MNNAEVLLNPNVLEEGARIVNETNERVANLLGINKAKRTTAIKPAGNSSILLETASGIHGEHSHKYIRNIKANRFEIGVGVLKEANPFSVTQSTTNPNDYNISFAIKPDYRSITKSSLLGVKQLEAVYIVQKHWVLPGTTVKETYGIKITHNVSNTILVAEGQWDEVRDYIWDHKDVFAGVSLLSTYGELDYADAPFQSVKTPTELTDLYGDAAILASGLITDGLHVFKHLWTACDAAKYDTLKDPEDTEELSEKLSLTKKHDWVRRLKKFSKNYCNNDLDKAVRCIKEVSILHKYNKLKNEVVDVDWSKVDFSTEAVKQASELELACSSGKCEI